MNAAAEIGRNPVSKHQIQPGCVERAGWRGAGRSNPSRETKFSGSNEDREKYSADHEQDWQRYPLDLYLRTKIFLWAGTLLRMSGGRLPKRIMFGNLEGAVPIGRGGKGKE